MGALGEIYFYMGTQLEWVDQNKNFDGMQGILIHTLELKLWHFKVLINMFV